MVCMRDAGAGAELIGGRRWSQPDAVAASLDHQSDPVNPYRRNLCAGTLVALAMPRVGVAQQPRMRRIGSLSVSEPDAPVTGAVWKMQIEALRRLGWEHEKNLLIERRYAAGYIARLDTLAAELVRSRVELIVAALNPSIIAARRATPTIPIVMLGGSFPVEFGFAKSLARPGGNVTGTAVQPIEQFSKTFQFLRDLAPRRTRIAWLSGSSLPGFEQATQMVRDEISGVAQALGMTIQYVDVKDVDDLARALEHIAASRIELLYVTLTGGIDRRLREIADFAIRSKILSAGSFTLFTSTGGAMYYGSNFQEAVDRTMSFVDRLLRGAKPGDLPVELPTKYEMVLNLRTLRAIDVSVPNHVLRQATNVIE